jgi:hypothetical protein
MIVKGLPGDSSYAEVYAELRTAAAKHGMMSYLPEDYEVLNEKRGYQLNMYKL